MGNQRCVNGKLDDSSFSSPMPIIGIYITGATLVCLLFILLDMYAGFRNRKRWLPCRLFSLNSVTLTLLAVATKLPVDLTTPMPSAQDQLSKLTGTTFICICMGFFMPSLGLTTESECISNMIALTIFVITAVVNICIQLHTGVIILFKAEHVTVLCCMMLMLMLLWYNALRVNENKQCFADLIKDKFKSGQGSLLQRLKACYMHSYDSNPQFMLCRKLICPINCAFCIVCAVVLLQVIFRSFVSKELEFCEGISDYRWSMWGIVVSQTITILVGCLGTTIRFLSLVKHLESDSIEFFGFAKLCGDDVSCHQKCFTIIIEIPATIVCFFILFLVLGTCALVIGPIKSFREATKLDDEAYFNIYKPKDEDEDLIKEYREIITEWGQVFDELTFRKGVKEMKRWVEMNRSKVLNHLIELLHRTPPSHVSLTTLLQNQHDPRRQRYKISPLAIVVLARFITDSIPSSLSQCIHDSLEEVFEVIYYIDRKMNSFRELDFNDLKAFDESFNLFVEKPKAEAFQSQTQLDQAIETIKDLKRDYEESEVEFYPMAEEIDMIFCFIEINKAYTSIEELYGDMEQLFVDMLNEVLAQLPGAIFKDIIESSPEDLEEKLKYTLKVVSKTEQLEGLVRWSFPLGTTITSFVTDAAMVDDNRETLESSSNAIVIDGDKDEIPITENQSSMSFEGTSSSTGNTLQPSVEGDVIPIVSHSTQDDEIIQIE